MIKENNFEFRKPTKFENELLNLLLSVDFVGKKVLLDQIYSSKVRIIDENGSFESLSISKVKIVDIYE